MFERRAPSPSAWRRARAASSILLLPLVAAALGGCGTASVPPGPSAADPACARIIQDAPDELLGLARHETSSQATLAWGSGEDAIVLRCGVTPPGPSPDVCTRISASDGQSVDWLVREKDGMVSFTTYGRTPAVDVTVPRAVAPDQPSAAVLEMTGSIAQLPASDHCLGPGDVR